MAGSLTDLVDGVPALPVPRAVFAAGATPAGMSDLRRFFAGTTWFGRRL
jgi:hypothetical protein